MASDSAAKVRIFCAKPCLIGDLAGYGKWGECYDPKKKKGAGFHQRPKNLFLLLKYLLTVEVLLAYG